MVLPTIPRPLKVNNNTNNNSVRYLQDSRSTAKAQVALRARYPKDSVVEMFYGKTGQPSKAYLKDGKGKFMTVKFNASQQVVTMQNGCH